MVYSILLERESTTSSSTPVLVYVCVSWLVQSGRFKLLVIHYILKRENATWNHFSYFIGSTVVIRISISISQWYFFCLNNVFSTQDKTLYSYIATVSRPIVWLAQNFLLFTFISYCWSKFVIRWDLIFIFFLSLFINYFLYFVTIFFL